MNVNFNENISRKLSSLQLTSGTMREQKSNDSSSAQSGRQVDKLVISAEGQQAAQGAGAFSKLECVAPSEDMKTLIEAAKEKAGTLQVNWDKVVDPDGMIYSKTYIETLVGKYEKAAATIEAYYTEAHQENLSFDQPYTHLLQKYKMPESPYFRSSMSEEERELSFKQERALLWGGRLTLKDPYALASSGGLLDAEKESEIARQAARNHLDQLIKERIEIENNGI